MVNRVLEVKRIKMRRRHRKARHDGEVVNLGYASLSNQKIGVGLRVPQRLPAKYSLNRERMQEINPKKDLVAEVSKELRLPIASDLAKETAKRLEGKNLSLKKCIFDGRKVKVFIFFGLGMKDIFLLKIDNRLNLTMKSCNFSSLQQAQDAFEFKPDTILWYNFSVEYNSADVSPS